MEQQYLAHAKNILSHGNVRPDRTGTGTRSIFGHQMRHDLMKGFPLLTSKFVPLRLIIQELVWILEGSTNNNHLVANNVHIWDEWALVDKKEHTVESRLLMINKMMAQWIHPAPKAWEATTHEEIDTQVEAFFALYHQHSTNDRVNITTTRRYWRMMSRFEHGPDDGKLGPVYGHQWRRWGSNAVTIDRIQQVLEDHKDNPAEGMAEMQRLVNHTREWGGIDQIQELMDGLKNKPFSRRHIVSGWNPDDMPDETKSHAENVSNNKQALPPCHTLFQFYVRDMELDDLRNNTPPVQWQDMLSEVYFATPEAAVAEEFLARPEEMARIREWLSKRGFFTRKLDCQLYQRSADWFLGVPFNIASYSLLTMMVAQCVDMLPGEFIHTFGDSHIYGNHVAVMKEQLEREVHRLPTVKINRTKSDIFSFCIDDFELVEYQNSGKLTGQVAV